MVTCSVPGCNSSKDKNPLHYSFHRFFHRMKLRNNTRFRINSLDMDLDKMRVKVHLSLNDLHLMGTFERAWNPPGGKDPSELYYVPTFGQAEILLQNVDYKLEGRLRLVGDNPYIVLTTSEIDFPYGIMTYSNNATNVHSHEVTKQTIIDFLDRMKSDLDKWLRDYLNEQLIFYSVRSASNSELREYHRKRDFELNDYLESALTFLRTKLRAINATAVKLPNFSIVSNVDFRLTNGVLRGLETIYRRSSATGGEDGGVRKVDAIVGFSCLTVQYKYTAVLSTDTPPLSGLLVLNADDLTAHMSMSLVKDPETVDLHFDFIHQFRPESLTVEGPANRMIVNYKHLLEHHIISIMSNGMFHNVRELSSLVKCQPNYYGYQSGEIIQQSKAVKPSSNENISIQQNSDIETLKQTKLQTPQQAPNSRIIEYSSEESYYESNIKKLSGRSFKVKASSVFNTKNFYTSKDTAVDRENIGTKTVKSSAEAGKTYTDGKIQAYAITSTLSIKNTQ